MKHYFINILLFVAVTLAVSCDKNFETMEGVDNLDGMPTSVGGITSKALPGQILLKWQVPIDSNFYLLKISYFDFLTQTKVHKVTSAFVDSIVIDNTREKFGKYDFTFQTFSADNQGGAASSIQAVSGKAPITETITRSKIALTVDQLSTNNQEPSEGPISNLIDGNAKTFFHTRWSSPQIPMPQYIQIQLKEAIDDFQFYLINRSSSQQAPKIVEVQISNDGVEWETIKTISAGLPSAGGADYTSAVFRPGRTFSYFRYNCLETFGGTKYFNLAEFEIYNVDIKTYDPEL